MITEMLYFYDKNFESLENSDMCVLTKNLNLDLLTSVDQSGDIAALKGDVQIKHMVTS